MTIVETPWDQVGLRPGISARHSGAKALLVTVLGEFVLPAGGAVWTSSLLAAAELLGVGEKNARQAIARIGDLGLIEPARHGRRVRWSLTRHGRGLLEDGARRIYSFGAAPIRWNGEWLVAFCPAPESGRSERHQLRNRLRFLGFGELSSTLLISPHLEREDELSAVLDDLGLSGESVVLHSTASIGDDADLVARAWDLDRLVAAYDGFIRANRERRPDGDDAAFRAVVELVHEWRRFPFTDPELPTELLPERWAGDLARRVFRDRHAGWSPAARRWFDEQESELPR